MKKRLTFMAAVLALVLSSVGVGAQQQAQSTISVNERAERIPNLDKLVTELKQYHDCTCKCGCYAHDLDLQADRAIAILRQRAAHRNSKEKLAVVLDIDETSLSNYQEMLENGFVFNKKVFDAWVETAQAPAIPGSLRIDKEAARLGVAVFFITGRPDSERAATENNLHAQGFNYQQLTLRPDSALKESVGAFKSDARAQIVAEGYKIVLNVGDQWSDLKGGPEAEFSVKYPDPYYYLP